MFCLYLSRTWKIIRGKCPRDVSQHVAATWVTLRNISMNKNSVLWREMPDKAKKKKKVDQLCVGEKKDVGAGEDVLLVLRALYCGRF